MTETGQEVPAISAHVHECNIREGPQFPDLRLGAREHFAENRN